jgi:hypothetical protein
MHKLKFILIIKRSRNWAFFFVRTITSGKSIKFVPAVVPTHLVIVRSSQSLVGFPRHQGY